MSCYQAIRVPSYPIALYYISVTKPSTCPFGRWGDWLDAGLRLYADATQAVRGTVAVPTGAARRTCAAKRLHGPESAGIVVSSGGSMTAPYTPA